MIVTKVEPLSKTKYKIYLNHQFAFVLYKGELRSYKISDGRELSEEELDEIEKLIQEVKKGLDEKNIPYKDIRTGIMIETPAAVMISDLLAKEVDFFSIGTNDLTQYTLAIDRQNAKLDNIYDSHHEAVLRMIQMVVDNAHKEGIWAGICGELGADTTLTERFVEMGLDELSVSPTFVLPVRKIVREME